MAAIMAEKAERKTVGDYLSVSQAAERLGITRDAVYKAGDRGDIPALEIGGKVMMRGADVDAYQARMAVPRRRGPGRPRKEEPK